MALNGKTFWFSVNSGTDVARSGTRDARRQFRDCPGHSGTVGNPNWDKQIKVARKGYNRARFTLRGAPGTLGIFATCSCQI